MNSILVEAWDTFEVSAGNIIREIFVKTKLLFLSPPNLTTNTQACAASTQVPSGSKYEETNEISSIIVAYIEVQETRAGYPMVVL